MGAELLTQGNQKLVFIAMARRFFPAGICGLLLVQLLLPLFLQQTPSY